MREALVEIYPNLPDKDATALALQGYGDLFTSGNTSDSSLYDKIIQDYGLTRNEMISISGDYKNRINGVKLKGTTCN